MQTITNNNQKKSKKNPHRSLGEDVVPQELLEFVFGLKIRTKRKRGWDALGFAGGSYGGQAAAPPSACRGCCRLALGPQLGWWGQRQSKVQDPAGGAAIHSSAKKAARRKTLGLWGEKGVPSKHVAGWTESERNTHVHQRKEAIELVILLQNISNCFVGKLKQMIIG